MTSGLGLFFMRKWPKIVNGVTCQQVAGRVAIQKVVV